MKHIISIALIAFSLSASCQDFPFVKDFAPGTITLADSSQKKGFIKWDMNQNERLRFKASDKDNVIKYSPVEITGFQSDTFEFKSLVGIELCVDEYPLRGKTSVVKHTFGRVLHNGPINIYIVYYSGNAPLTGPGIFPNVVFEKSGNNQKEYAAYPILIRMKNNRYEKAKEPLYSFFSSYPAIVERIKVYKQEQDFFEIIDLVKQIK